MHTTVSPNIVIIIIIIILFIHLTFFNLEAYHMLTRECTEKIEKKKTAY